MELSVFIACIVVFMVFYLYFKMGLLNIRHFEEWDKVQAKVLYIKNRCPGSYSKKTIIEYEYNGKVYANVILYAYGFGYLPGKYIEIAVDKDNPECITSKAASFDVVVGIIGMLSIIILLSLSFAGII